MSPGVDSEHTAGSGPITAQILPAVRHTLPVPMCVAEPPYFETRPFRLGDDVALGGIVHAGSSDLLAGLAELAQVVDSNPWAIPALSVPPHRIRSLRALGTCFPGSFFEHLALYPVNINGYLATAGELKRAVMIRPAPTVSAMADYVATRLDRPDSSPLLAEIFLRAFTGNSAQTQRSVATYSRRFSALGKYTARDWERIASLTRALSNAAYRGERSSRINGWCRKFLGRSHRAACKHVGWEWLLESVLRRGGYVVGGTGGR